MSHSDYPDLLIIGSGPAGAQAAKQAIQEGMSVWMIDVGHEVDEAFPAAPDRPFSEIRKSDPSQRRYFLGDGLEGVPTGETRVGAQLTPPRQFITRDTESLLPFESPQFSPMQSLALGGLGAGWGASCFSYTAEELSQIGLPAPEMPKWYEAVSRDIGVSGTDQDDTSPLLGQIPSMQAPLEIDTNTRALFASYQRNREKLRSRGMTLGRIPLAILSEPLSGPGGTRRPNPYHDMDFYTDVSESVYRPKYSIRDLRTSPRFRYIGQTLAETYTESPDGTVEVRAQNLRSGESVTLRGKSLLLAAGAIGSARLALASGRKYGERTPILCNPYTYIPCIHLRMLGRPTSDSRHSLAQLVAIQQRDRDSSVAQIYSYRSLLLFKLVKEMPLPPWFGLQAARILQTSLTIAGVHHADRPSSDRWIELQPSEPGGVARIRCQFKRSDAERVSQDSDERALMRNLWTLGCLPMKRVSPGEAASIHYAGTIPFASHDGPKPLSCDIRGKLHGTHSIFVADSSSWRYLPAKGLTFTLMANARRIARAACQDLRARISP